MADKQIEQAIFETMASLATEEEKEELYKRVKEVSQKLQELSELFDISEKGIYENKSNYYSANFGWNSYLYRIKSVNNYSKALHLITEILDLIRGNPLMLEVYKIEHDSQGKVTSIKKFIGKESNVTLVQRKTRYGDSFVEEVHYLQQDLQRQEITDKNFLKHYENFERIAKTHFQKHEREKKYANFNEGHIIEAYQRHIAWNKDDTYTDVLSKKHVAIMLYYSMNSTGWWQGGDVGYTQIKGDNTRLATQKSIKMVANKLIQMYQNPETFTPEEFKKMFSINDIEEMTEYRKMSKRTLKELLDTDLKSLNTQNVKFTLEMDES